MFLRRNKNRVGAAGMDTQTPSLTRGTEPGTNRGPRIGRLEAQPRPATRPQPRKRHSTTGEPSFRNGRSLTPSFLKRRISVHRNAVQVGQNFGVGETKGKENRLVPVAASVLSRLAARCSGRSANDLLFPARGGGYLKRSGHYSTGWLNRAVGLAQVQTITPRDLRHAAASLASAPVRTSLRFPRRSPG